MSEKNVVYATLGGFSQFVSTRSLFQYDYGITLKFKGIELPDEYEVHFANSESAETAQLETGNADGVLIPDELLATGSPVYAWIMIHTGEDDGETIYRVKIPVYSRPKVEPEKLDIELPSVPIINPGTETNE